MMFHGDLDRNVNVAQAQFMADQLKDAGASPQLFIYKNLDHYLEDGAVRAEMLQKSSDFLKAKLLLQ
jgi:dipeptidyl aminopeptidase/acylaminoacyl peptidase